MRSGTAVADYLIVEELGAASTGREFLATPPERLGLSVDLVVLKLVAGGTPKKFERFTRELQLFAQIQDRHLVELYDAGQFDDWFFLTREHCAGGSLDSASHLSRPQRRRAVADAARAAHALHTAGIVHTDIRPTTVLLRADGTAVLADLGLARIETGSMSAMAPTEAVGFLDPALLLGDAPTAAADVFSLGATLHFALTGQHLFAGLDPNEPLKAVRTVLRAEARPVRDLLTAEEADLIAAATAKDASHRIPNAAEFAILVDHLQGE